MAWNGRNDELDVVAMKNVVCLLAVRFKNFHWRWGRETSHVCSFSRRFSSSASSAWDDMLDRIFQLFAGHALWQFTIRKKAEKWTSCCRALLLFLPLLFIPSDCHFGIFWLWQHVDNALPRHLLQKRCHASLKEDYVSVFICMLPQYTSILYIYSARRRAQPSCRTLRAIHVSPDLACNTHAAVHKNMGMYVVDDSENGYDCKRWRCIKGGRRIFPCWYYYIKPITLAAMSCSHVRPFARYQELARSAYLCFAIGFKVPPSLHHHHPLLSLYRWHANAFY